MLNTNLIESKKMDDMTSKKTISAGVKKQKIFDMIELNIRLLISYVITAVCTYYIGFGVSKFLEPDLLKLIFIIGTFIISFVLSFWIIGRILPLGKKLSERNKIVAGFCVALLCLCLIIEAAHLFYMV